MVVGDNNSTATKNAGESMAISIAMVMQRYDAGHIARWITSGASLKASGCSHRSSACAVSPLTPAAAMVKEFESNTQNTNKTQLLASNYGTFRVLVVCENFNPNTDRLLSSSI
jgi:hypothetical protein